MSIWSLSWESFKCGRRNLDLRLSVSFIVWAKACIVIISYSTKESWFQSLLTGVSRATFCESCVIRPWLVDWYRECIHMDLDHDGLHLCIHMSLRWCLVLWALGLEFWEYLECWEFLLCLTSCCLLRVPLLMGQVEKPGWLIWWLRWMPMHMYLWAWGVRDLARATRLGLGWRVNNEEGEAVGWTSDCWWMSVWFACTLSWTSVCFTYGESILNWTSVCLTCIGNLLLSEYVNAGCDWGLLHSAISCSSGNSSSSSSVTFNWILKSIYCKARVSRCTWDSREAPMLCEKTVFFFSLIYRFFLSCLAINNDGQ